VVQAASRQDRLPQGFQISLEAAPLQQMLPEVKGPSWEWIPWRRSTRLRRSSAGARQLYALLDNRFAILSLRSVAWLC